MLFPGGSQVGVLKVRHCISEEKSTKAARYNTNMTIFSEFVILQYLHTLVLKYGLHYDILYNVHCNILR